MKVHESAEGRVVGVCDEELLGKIFTEGDRVLSINDAFFGGKKTTLKEIEKTLKTCLTAHVVGNKIVSEFLSKKTISEDGVLEVKGIKHAMIFRI